MKLIMYLALVESGYQFFLIQQFYICKFNLHQLFAQTIYYSVDPYYVYKATNILMCSCLFQATFCIQLGQLFNICLCVDLVLMVRYPFDSKDGRVNRYLIISILLALIPSIFISIDETEESQIRRVGDTMAFSLRIIFLTTFIFSVVYTWNKMRGPSFSKEVRRLVL